MIRYSSTLFLLLVILFGCKDIKKDFEPKLPEATQEGKNTFGCLINGELFLPKGGFSLPSLTATYYNGGVFTINAVNADNGTDKKYIEIGSLDTTITKIGSYPLGLKGAKIFVGEYFREGNGCEMETDSINTGMLTITKYMPPPKGSSKQGIISGTFYFTVKKNKCPDINITDGRFDIAF